MAGAKILRPPVHRITLAQLAILVLLCLILLASDKVRAYSVFSGGLIAILASVGMPSFKNGVMLLKKKLGLSVCACGQLSAKKSRGFRTSKSG